MFILRAMPSRIVAARDMALEFGAGQEACVRERTEHVRERARLGEEEYPHLEKSSILRRPLPQAQRDPPGAPRLLLLTDIEALLQRIAGNRSADGAASGGGSGTRGVAVAASEDQSCFRAELLDAKRPEQRARLESLLASERTRVSDTLLEQLAELLESREPAAPRTPQGLEARSREWLDGPAWAYGSWAYYPWDGRLVHLLPEREHFELRTDRNRHKITSAEQRRLRDLRIGVIGLSAGQAITLTLVQEGIGGAYRLADFDRLTLSNLNRVRGRVHELGLPKTVMLARAIAEIDPYLEVEIFPAGFEAQSAPAFFDADSGPLDFLIEVCDSIDVKALARIHARERRVPVLMVNSEGGILDIERFDREPDRPIFHGLMPPEIDPLSLSDADLDTKVAFLLPIVGLENLSDRMIASLVEAGSTVSTWPQLASGVTLGGALVANALRRIALGELDDSGRHAITIEKLVANGNGDRAVVPTARSASEPPPPALDDRESPLSPPPPTPVRGALTPPHGTPFVAVRASGTSAALQAIAAAALAAPSGANAQPCRFVLDGQRLEIHRRIAVQAPAFDPDDHSAWIAAGAATENAVLAATSLGWAAAIELQPLREPTLPLVRLDFTPATTPADPLARFIERRCTNRKPFEPIPLSESDRALLGAAVAERGATLTLVEDETRRALIADLIGAADRLRLLSSPMLRDLAGELRWTPEHVERTRDGIDVRALELKAGELASLRMMLRPPAMSFLRSIGGGDRIRRLARPAVVGSPALGLVACDAAGSTESETFFRAGRAIERLWLQATERGLSLSPMTTLLFVMRLAARQPGFLSADEQQEIGGLKRTFEAALPLPTGAVPVFLFRIGRAGAPTVRALRKRLEDMLEIRG
jgi:molybdopterin/thiamine biosynthesis adenylyltransferase